MRKLILLLLFLASTVHANGPMFKHDKVDVENEFLNVYHDLLYQRQVSVQASTGTFTYINASTITALSGTITNLTVTGTLTGTSTSLGKIRQIVKCTSAASDSTTSSTLQSSSLSCQITPTLATSSITISAMGNLVNHSTNRVAVIATIANGTTDLLSGAGCIFNVQSTPTAADWTTPCYMSTMQAPNSTSQQTYRVRFSNNDNSSPVQWGINAYTQTMILVEYAP